MFNFKNIDNIYHNSYSGVVCNNIDKIITDEKTIQQLAQSKYENKKRACNMSIEYKQIKTINVHPVGRICYGDCVYCYNEYYPYDKFSDGYLTAERFDLFLNKIKNNISNDTLFKFTGGSCFLYDDLYKLFDVIKKYINNINLRFHADMMYSDNKYKDVLKLFYKLNNDKDIKSVKMYITTDYGSPTRLSKSLNLTHLDIQNRAKQIVDEFGGFEKFQIEIKTNLNSLTDNKTMVDSFEDMFNRNCLLVYNPTRHKIYTPQQTHLKSMLDVLDNNYESKVIYKREKILINDYFKECYKNKKDTSIYTVFYKLSDGVYQINPYHFDCPGYVLATGISPSGYIPCFIGYIDETNDDNIMQISKNNKIYHNFFNNPSECLTCTYYGVCMRCMLRKHLLSCNDVPSLKYWESYIWESKMKEHNEYWLDENLNSLIM